MVLFLLISWRRASGQLSCGQINVTGGGSGSPGPVVAIPGVYTGYVRAALSQTLSHIHPVFSVAGAGHSHQHQCESLALVACRNVSDPHLAVPHPWYA